jgi:hypothetical protein
MNCYLDHVFCCVDQYVDDAGGTLTEMEAPTQEPDPLV